MRATNAHQVHPVRLVVLVLMVHQAVRASRANQEKITERAKIVEPAARLSRLRHPVKDHQARLVQRDRLDPKARPVHPEIQVKEADSAPLDRPDRRVQREEMANPDPKARLEPMPPEEKARRDPKDHPDPLVNPDPKDLTAHQQPAAAELVNQDQLVHRVHPVPDPPLANKARKVRPAIPVQTPNIVLVHHEAAWSIAVALSLFCAISTKQSTI